jgi:hypothetical protein
MSNACMHVYVYKSITVYELGIHVNIHTCSVVKKKVRRVEFNYSLPDLKKNKKEKEKENTMQEKR